MDAKHTRAVNQTIDYIQAHLNEPVTLNQLAQVACYSEYHLARVFKSLTDETVYSFIKRLRLERAAELLISNPGLPVTDIALTVGFANASAFAKAFQSRFGMTASDWRVQKRQRQSPDNTRYSISLQSGQPCWKVLRENVEQTVRIEKVSPFRVAYVRHHGDYQTDEALFSQLYQRLMAWATANNQFRESSQCFNIYHDSPSITASDQLRVMVAMSVDEAARPSGNISTEKLAGGLYACSEFKLRGNEFGQAWQWMFETWLPLTGYVIDTRPSFERSLPQPDEKKGLYTVDICIPIKPA